MGLALAVLAPQVSAHAGHHTHAHTQMSTDRTAKYDICAQTRNHRLNAHTHTHRHIQETVSALPMLAPKVGACIHGDARAPTSLQSSSLLLAPY